MSPPLDPADRGYLHRHYLSPIDDSRQPFSLWIPRTYTRSREYPLIVALHGADADERMIPEACLRMHERGFREDLIFVSPYGRGEVDYRWFGEADLWDVLNLVKSVYRIDARRQYLTGLSMGGFATWRLAAEYPEQWAAIAPVCGGGDAGMIEGLKGLPIWCVHGKDDPMVPVEQSRALIRPLLRQGGPVRYSELAGWGHNSWEWLYQSRRRAHELVRWFFRFSKELPAPPQRKPKRRGCFKDLFSERVIITYPAAAARRGEAELLEEEAQAWSRFDFGETTMGCGKLIVKNDTELTAEDLRGANHLMLGRSDNHVWLKKARTKLLARHRGGQLEMAGERYLGKALVAAACQSSPWNPKQLLGVVTYQQFRQMRGIGEILCNSEIEPGMINLYDADCGRFLRSTPDA